MKKNLLALFALGGIFSTTYAQDTYINDAVVVKVNPNTLFYNGGTVAVNTTNTTATTEKIINEGNIQINGGFTNTNSVGKNFVNRYTSTSSYGQLIIKDQTTVTGKVSIERSTPDVNDNSSYYIALPFKNSTAKNVINSLTDADIFRGDCALNINCGDNRYDQTLFSWDIAETEYDATQNNTIIKPENSYLLRFINFNESKNALAYAINNLTTNFQLAAIPNNDAIDTNLKSGLRNNDQSYDSEKFGIWKKYHNNYGEFYSSYIGNLSNDYDNSSIFGKNLHRLGNPFTSNLDLSNVQTGESWITFKTKNGQNMSPAEAWPALRFRIYKLTNNYTLSWNSSQGSSHSDKTTTVSANLLKNGNNNEYFWTGSPEALLIKPYETFYIYYNAINKSENGDTNIIDARVQLGDPQKTFNYDYTTVGTSGNPPKDVYSRSFNSSTNINTPLLDNESLKAKGLVTEFDFTQLELFLTNSNTNFLQGNATYLLNANFMNTGSTSVNSTVDNPIFFYEETKDGKVLVNSQTLSNQFNSEDYIGKPIRIGFNGLVQGNNYRLNLNLYEKSILNKVKTLTQGKYYLLDKLTKKIVEVDEATEISFTADDKINDRFEFYWNEKPAGTLGTDDLNKTNTTYLYSDNNKNQFIRFEQSNTTADISVFDLTGRQIFSKNSVTTNSDYQLNLNNIPSVYVVKITYKDGKTVTKKTIKK